MLKPRKINKQKLIKQLDLAQKKYPTFLMMIKNS